MAGPLKGLKVLSFARALAGPYASMLFCDLGAEVIKIEEPEHGDTARRNGPFIKGISSYFLSVNRGKKSITLNLRDEKAKKIVYDLAKKVDILIENFRPGVMKRLGIHYDAIQEHNPAIIYASISGFGQTGPRSQKPALDMIAQSTGGVVSITGEPDGAPVRVGYSIGDMGAALFTTVAVLAALHEREKSGKGQWIDISMVDSQVALCENAITRYFATGEIPKSFGSRHPLFTPFQIFPTKDGSITLIAYRENQWKVFCTAVGKKEWIHDEKFKTNAARLQNYSTYIKNMNGLMRTRTTKEWLALFERHDVMCAPVNDIEAVLNDPQILERNMVAETHHAEAGTLKVVGTPMKFSKTACRIEKACPDLGEHTDEVLSELLGISEKEIHELRSSKAI